jgi:hypothetical protein
MFSRCQSVCVDGDTTTLCREVSRPETMRHATRARDIGER